MGAHLIERWARGAGAVLVQDVASLSAVRELVRRDAAEAGLDVVAAEGLATAATELARNQLDHARAGRVAVRLVERAGARGVEVVAADAGPGIADPAAALAGTAPPGGLGAGLSGARRLTHELDLDVRAGEGTCVRVRTFARPVPRSEVAIFGRPFPGEALSGDDGAFVRTADHLLVALADGLGHGPEARAAAAAAIDAAVAEPAAPLAGLVERCRQAVVGTRGAVLALVRLHLATRAIEHLGIGDVQVVVRGPDGTQLLQGVPGHLSGRSQERARVRLNAASLSPHGLLLASTDGLRSAAVAAIEPAVEPVGLAQRLVAGFGRPTDDALVVVVRTG